MKKGKENNRIKPIFLPFFHLLFPAQFNSLQKLLIDLTQQLPKQQ